MVDLELVGAKINGRRSMTGSDPISFLRLVHSNDHDAKLLNQCAVYLILRQAHYEKINKYAKYFAL